MQHLKDCFIKSKFDLIRNDRFYQTFSTLFFLVVILISFQFCSNQKNVDLETLSKVYVDLLVVEDFYSGTDSVKIKKEEVFKKYEIDSTSYFNSYKSLKYNDAKWNEFFNLSQAYLDTLKSKQKKN